MPRRRKHLGLTLDEWRASIVKDQGHEWAAKYGDNSLLAAVFVADGSASEAWLRPSVSTHGETPSIRVSV